MQNPILEAIRERRSVRHFIPGVPATKDELITLVKAGMAAPTACNRRPWAFIAIDDPLMVQGIAAIHSHASFLRDAGSAIVVCGDLSRAMESVPGYWIQDCAAATENILLAVESLGLGATWCGIHPNPEVEPVMRKLLGVPENIIPFGLIVVGHPAGHERAQDKFDPKRLHWQRWNQ